jgi:drug/metabolite transporter (DMT)-like permease
MKSGSFNNNILYLAAGASIISFSGVYVKMVNVGPTATGFYRTFIGAIILLVILIIKRERLWYGINNFLISALCGIAFALDLFCWHKSVLYIGPGLSTILANFQVFFLAAFGFFILKERIGIRYFGSIILAIIGLFMIVGFKWGSFPDKYRLGIFLALITAAAYSSYILLLRLLQSKEKRLSTTANLATVSIIASACLWLMSLLEGQSLIIPDLPSMVYLFIYGLLSQVVAWLLISKALPNVKASLAGLILLLQPALAFAWDILFFKRDIGIISGIGVFVALAGIYSGTARRKASGVDNI